MLQIAHPRVSRATIMLAVELPDPNVKRVLRVETDMPLPGESGFNQEDYDALCKAVLAAMERHGAERAEVGRDVLPKSLPL